MLDSIDVNYFLKVHDPETVGTIGSLDVSVSCPLCREGKSWKRKHRLHLYIKKGYDTSSVHCWNCGYSSNIYGYLKEYYPHEFSNFIKEKSGKNFKKLEMEYKKKPVPETKPQKEAPFLIDPIKNFTPLPKEVLEYIHSRNIEPQKDWLYSPKNNQINFNKKNIILSEYIIIPFLLNNKWYGFQALGWKQKRFLIHLVDGNTGYKIWNWAKIDKNKPVYIFESVYDALSSGLDNVLASLGANIDIDRLKELKEPIFCLDNTIIDEKARNETLKYLEMGYKCFIWPKGSEKFKDTNDLRKKGVSYEKIRNMILKNIFKGIQGIVRLKIQ